MHIIFDIPVRNEMRYQTLRDLSRVPTTSQGLLLDLSRLGHQAFRKVSPIRA